MVGTLARVLRTGPRLESVGAATQTEDRTVQRNDVSFFEADEFTDIGRHDRLH